LTTIVYYVRKQIEDEFKKEKNLALLDCVDLQDFGKPSLTH